MQYILVTNYVIHAAFKELYSMIHLCVLDLYGVRLMPNGSAQPFILARVGFGTGTFHPVYIVSELKLISTLRLKKT